MNCASTDTLRLLVEVAAKLEAEPAKAERDETAIWVIDRFDSTEDDKLDKARWGYRAFDIMKAFTAT